MTPHDDDVFAQSLLDAARDDAPPADALTRELARLGAVGVLGASAAGTAAAGAGGSTACAAGAAAGMTKAGGAGAATTVGVGAAKGAAITTSVKVGASLATLAGKLTLGVVAVSAATAVALSAGEGATAPESSPSVPVAVEARPAVGQVIGAPETTDRARRADEPRDRSDSPSPTAEVGRPLEAVGRAADQGEGGRALAGAAGPEIPRAPAAAAAGAVPSRSVEAPSASVGAVVEESLSEEVALIDRARATSASRPRAALALLDEHARRFPAGVLRDEAAVLRVEALVASGDRAAALRVATPYLDRRGGSLTAARMRALIHDGGAIP